MTILLLYAYCVGIVSSRKIERACYEDLAFRVLTGNQQPDHSRVSEFRRRNLDALKGLFIKILRLCQKAGLVRLGNVALDGTKVQANASKGKLGPSYRMSSGRQNRLAKIRQARQGMEAEKAATYQKAEACRPLTSTLFQQPPQSNPCTPGVMRQLCWRSWARKLSIEAPLLRYLPDDGCSGE